MILRASICSLLLVTACSTRTTMFGERVRRDSGVGPRTDARVGREAGTTDAGAPDAGAPLRIADAGMVSCGDHICACSNLKDDDQDGKIDGFDPECTGPFDDDEASFATGVHGEAKDAHCLDCAFDGNSGSGDDDCRIASSCRVDGTAKGGGACGTCTPTDLCVTRCADRTPNGCDCFGCCEVQTSRGAVSIMLRDSCSMANLDDPNKCPPCERNEVCVNECGRCELCPGKDPASLPADCESSAGGLGYDCEGGKLCGADLPCGDLQYCQFGCCVPILI